MKILSILLVALFSFNASAGISPHTRKIREMRKAERHSKGTERATQNALERGQLGLVSVHAIKTLLKKADKTLKRKKRINWNLEETFTIHYEQQLMSVNTMSVIQLYELGDFEPMFVWLDNVYTQLENLLGEGVMSSTKLSDLDDLNHALRVVLYPRDARWDRAEYKLHFVPFGKIVGYWTVMGGCFAFNRFVLTEKIICAPIAMGSRAFFGLIADPLSDVIYSGVGGELN